MKVLLALLLALGAVPARAHDFTVLEGMAMATAVSDLASTRYAMARGGREMNPLLGSDPGNRTLIVAGALRLAAIYAAGELLPAGEAQRAFRVISCIQLGVTASNLTIERDPAVRFEWFVLGVTIPLALPQ